MTADEIRANLPEVPYTENGSIVFNVNKLQIAMLGEIAAQLAELNETLRRIYTKSTDAGPQQADPLTPFAVNTNPLPTKEAGVQTAKPTP